MYESALTHVRKQMDFDAEFLHANWTEIAANYWTDQFGDFYRIQEREVE